MLENVVYKLIQDNLILIKCFLDNQMQANPGKFHAIAVGKKTKDENISFNIDNNNIKCEESVKPLVLTIDFQLNFDLHISNI